MILAKGLVLLVGAITLALFKTQGRRSQLEWAQLRLKEEEEEEM